ncbi:hypothetical protein [Sinosporangium siamense]|uniref:Uncharacterized protein n=1 Tax=Sinosporangium siamense TaxID=1367973 RepID=A0A919RNM6_9ACTN|nr:hypothetical protein [Sinosporangium siamense]GII97101.1 hypothetical protein Ssi02_73320 [Sinosporangium siamense]
MIASPPGWGPWNRKTWLTGILAHVAGLPVGAVGSALIWHGIGNLIGHIPPVWLGVISLALAAVVSGLLPIALDGSSWRVPRSWGAWEHGPYAGVFGVALGTGFVTALASPALYLVMAWGIASPEWSATWPVFLAFAVGRAIPFIFITVAAARRKEDPADPLERASPYIQKLAFVEAMLLAGLSIVFLLG